MVTADSVARYVALLQYWEEIAANPSAAWMVRQTAHRCACELKTVISGGAAPAHRKKQVCVGCGCIVDVGIELCPNESCAIRCKGYANWSTVYVQDSRYEDTALYPPMPPDARMFELPWGPDERCSGEFTLLPW